MLLLIKYGDKFLLSEFALLVVVWIDVCSILHIFLRWMFYLHYKILYTVAIWIKMHCICCLFLLLSIKNPVAQFSLCLAKILCQHLAEEVRYTTPFVYNFSLFLFETNSFFSFTKLHTLHYIVFCTFSFLGFSSFPSQLVA